MAAPVQTIGYIAADGGSEYIPIYSLPDGIDLGRGQEWNVRVLGPQSTNVAVWTGSRPVFYDINFELLVGWGKVKDLGQLQGCMRLFHSLCSHQVDASGKTSPPPPVKLVIGGQIDQVGFLEDCRTKLKPPWVIDQSTGSNRLTGISCQFTGKFWFMPGMQANGIVAIQRNVRTLSSAQVRSRFYVQA
jgi:hypothetical protein